MKKIFVPFACMAIMPAFADMAELNSAIGDVRKNCGDISKSLAHIKTMAGINTAVTGVGTATSVGALAAGVVKSNVDKKINAALLVIEDEDAFYKEVTEYAEMLQQQNANRPADQIQELTDKSKTMGNVRTGLMATSTATAIAGAVIAGTNQVKDDLATQIGKCTASVNKLSGVYMSARMDADADSATISHAENIISECGAWETADVDAISKRARGAAVSSGIGAGVGLAGTITSGVANSDDVRKGDTDREQKLNTASNVMAGVTTAAGATATIFNATQIAAVKRVVEIAEKCEGSLK